MTKAQVQIGNALLKSLVDLKGKSGSLNIEDVGAMFENIASSIQTEGNDGALLRNEIEKIASYISNARSELGSIETDGEVDENKDISKAGEELDEVVRATEEATNTILDNADIIQEKVGELADKEAAAAIEAAVTEIYNACNFQDITGQRIRKVISVIEYVEYKIGKLRELLGNGEFKATASEEEKERFEDKRADAELLNGPQLPADAASQADIDALFDSI